MPDFSYSRLQIKELTWGLPSTRINLYLTDLPKEKTPTVAYQKRFQEVSRINKKDGITYIQTALKAKLEWELQLPLETPQICITTKI